MKKPTVYTAGTARVGFYLKAKRSMTQQLATINGQPTMSSLELVDFINADREAEGNAKRIQHSDFMKKVPKVLGSAAGNFSHSYIDSSGKANRCYKFPKREASLMAMSYSYELQAKVYDRMTALESGSGTALQTVKDPVLAAHIRTLIEVDAIKTEQQRQAIELSKLQETLAVVEARTQPENKHFTVMGWANLQGQKVDIGLAARIGRKCAELSRDQGISIGDVSDPRFGKVHSYHETILQAVFDNATQAA